MGNKKPTFLVIVGAVSERAGSIMGKIVDAGCKIGNFANDSVSAGKKAIGLSDKGSKPTVSEKKAQKSKEAKFRSDIAGAKHELTESEKIRTKLESQLKTWRAKNESLTSELDQTRKQLNETTDQRNAVKARTVALESELADARCKLDEMQSKIAKAMAIVEKNEASVEEAAQNEDEQMSENVEIVEFVVDSDQKPELMVGDEVSEQPIVKLNDVESANFANENDKAILTKALSDLVSQDTSVRVDAAKAIAGIEHELSASILVGHMKDEPLAVVRRECIKALGTLEMEEGISVVEHALSDKAASVRLAAVWGVYRLAGVESVSTLAKMSCDDNEGVRRRAVTYIGRLGDQIGPSANVQYRRVASVLMECLNDSAESVRKASLDSLQAVTGKKMESISTDQNTLESLIEQWRNWWQAEG